MRDRSRIVTCLIVSVAVSFFVKGPAICKAAAPPPFTPTRSDVDRAIRQLGDENFKVRERAGAWLERVGPFAKPALRQAMHHKDPEVANRARVISAKVKHLLPPNTPKDVAELHRRYRSATDDRNRIRILEQLQKNGTRGYRVLLDLLDEEENADLREEWFASLGREAFAVAGFLLHEGRTREAQQVLELALREPDSGRGFILVRRFNAPCQLAVFHRQQGTLDSAIARVEAYARKPGNEELGLVLAFLYRARGDLLAALRAARAIKRDDLIALLLVERQAWRELAALPESKPQVTEPGHLVKYLGRKAAYLRLAGDREGFRKALADLRKNAAAKRDEDRRSLAWPTAAVLLLNDQPAEAALDLLRKNKDPLHEFQVLCAQRRFREALALSDKDLPPDPRRLSWFALSKARALMSLGERKQAAALMEKVFRELEGTIDDRRYWYFLEAEHRMELHDEAADHCLRILKMSAKRKPGRKTNPTWDLPSPESLIEAAVTVDRYAFVERWYSLLRNGEPDKATLTGMRNLLAGRIQGAALETMLRDGEAAWLDQPGPNGLLVLARTALFAGRKDLARRYWQRCAAGEVVGWDQIEAEVEALQGLGALAVGEKDWGAAARYYHQAWERNPLDARSLYLAGHSLFQDGRRTEGRKRIAQARRVPLGDDLPRCLLARELAERGEVDAALQEYDLVIRNGPGEDFYLISEALVALARAATLRGDFTSAAALHERVRLLNLQFNLGRSRTGIYLLLTHRVRVARALALLAAGKSDQARKEWKACQELLPGNVDLAIALVPRLKAKGLHKDAAQIFKAAYDLHLRLCADHPRCAWAHHDLAWLLVNCRHRPDKALAHATRAVELRPDNVLYRDTLAEAHFQRGDRTRALAILANDLAQQPTSAYFTRQIARVRRGNAREALPREGMFQSRTQEACLLAKDLLSETSRIAGPVLFKGRGSGNVGSDSYSP
jgi:predicted Zn-dependent protease